MLKVSLVKQCNLLFSGIRKLLKLVRNTNGNSNSFIYCSELLDVKLIDLQCEGIICIIRVCKMEEV